MLVTNLTSQDIYFGPLHVGPFASNVTIDDTSATSLYLTSDAVADALNNAYISNKIQVSGAADPFPRPTGVPQLLHGDGSPEGVVYAPQGSVFMRRDGLLTNGGVLYLKTTGVTYNSGWLDLATASGAIQAIPAGAISSYGGAAAPAGWLLCDGAAISRTVYSVLYTAIGTNYGAGDGSTTFNLPDLEGRVPVGKGAHADVDVLGESDGVALASRRPRHQHTVGDPGHLHTISDPGHAHGLTDPGHSHTTTIPNPSASGSVDLTTQARTKTGQTAWPSSSATTGVTVNNSATAITVNNHSAGITVGQTVNAPIDSAAYLVVNYIIKT